MREDASAASGANQQAGASGREQTRNLSGQATCMCFACRCDGDNVHESGRLCPGQLLFFSPQGFVTLGSSLLGALQTLSPPVGCLTQNAVSGHLPTTGHHHTDPKAGECGAGASQDLTFPTLHTSRRPYQSHPPSSAFLAMLPCWLPEVAPTHLRRRCALRLPQGLKAK